MSDIIKITSAIEGERQALRKSSTDKRNHPKFREFCEFAAVMLESLLTRLSGPSSEPIDGTRRITLYGYVQFTDDGREELIVQTVRYIWDDAARALDRFRTSKDDDLSRYGLRHLTVEWTFGEEHSKWRKENAGEAVQERKPLEGMRGEDGPVNGS